jgi:hypothetical protein
MKRLNTFESNFHESRMHVSTLIKSKIKDVVEFCDKMSIFYFKEDVFRTFNVSHAIEWRTLSNASRKHHNEFTTYETRDLQAIMTSQKTHEMKRILKEDEFETRAFIWEQLDYEVDLECS